MNYQRFNQPNTARALTASLFCGIIENACLLNTIKNPTILTVNSKMAFHFNLTGWLHFRIVFSASWCLLLNDFITAVCSIQCRNCIFKRSVFQIPGVYGCVSKRLMIGNKLILAIIETLQERFPFLGQKISIFQMIHSVVWWYWLMNGSHTQKCEPFQPHKMSHFKTNKSILIKMA